jgi:cobalt/nickel transport system permease protein
VVYLQRTNRAALELTAQAVMPADVGTFGRLRAFWVALVVLIFATPLGLLAPGTAWGEWGAAQLKGLGFSFVPKGLQALEGLWGAPLKGYALPALGNSSAGYILSAGVGIVVVAIVAWLFTTLLTSNRPPSAREH